MDLVPQNLSLYMAGLAILLTVLTALYFYQKVKVVQFDIIKLREYKTQITSCHDKIVSLTERVHELESVPPLANSTVEVEKEPVIEEEEVLTPL